LIGTPQQVVDRIGEYVALGASGFVLWFPDYPLNDSMELFASEVMPHFERE
jgi:alkanesulfonate monooxygenase SsuD/methylene tetrahydromethanopterin reductase-like flavin-dependent oxidoreductase (luciferase family)